MDVEPYAKRGKEREASRILLNNQFKELNDMVGSKRAYIKNPAAKLALLLIWFLGWTIFQAFRLLVAIQRLLRGVKSKKRFLQMLILSGEISLYFDST